MPLGVSSLVNCSCEPMLRCPWAFKVMLPPLYEAIWEDVISRLPAKVMFKAAPAGEIEAIEPICSPLNASEEAGKSWLFAYRLLMAAWSIVKLIGYNTGLPFASTVGTPVN